jgi:hypothetical protein
LQRDAAQVVERLGSVTGVLVTGDMAFPGAREEYVKAGARLTGFAAAIMCPEENVWTVPGSLALRPVE